MEQQTYIADEDLHPHLKARMLQRGVTREEIEQTLNEGWTASDAKPGTAGKVFVFPYRAEWEGHFFEEKEVTVYYKVVGKATVLLTVKARYGSNFPRR
ncbi:MAG TPA: DUF4258 domain-containing protein [Desulfobacterales bacterium]|nr:DUF4258 domain-containing protein [Desulfobacterales bacterium]